MSKTQQAPTAAAPKAGGNVKAQEPVAPEVESQEVVPAVESDGVGDTDAQEVAASEDADLREAISTLQAELAQLKEDISVMLKRHWNATELLHEMIKSISKGEAVKDPRTLHGAVDELKAPY